MQRKKIEDDVFDTSRQRIGTSVRALSTTANHAHDTIATMIFQQRYHAPSLLKKLAMLLFVPVSMFALPWLLLVFSPLLIPLALLLVGPWLVIGGNPIPYTLEFLADAGPRLRHWLGSIGPRMLDRSPPHPSFAHDGEFPTIENVPGEFRWQFAMVRGPTYIRKMISSLITSTYYALFRYKIRAMDDDEMGRVFSRSTYIKFLERVEEIPRWAAEAGVQGTPSERVSYYIIDCSTVNQVKTYQGMYSSSTVSLWRSTERGERAAAQDVMARRKPSDFSELLPIAILMMPKGRNPYVVRPNDNAWDAAKLFVVHGCGHLGVLRDHPKIHFPFDSINVYTLRLSRDHLIRKLLAPHQQFTLCLNDIVLNSYFLSIVLNPFMTQSPFDADPEELRQYLQMMRDKFKFDMEPFPAENPHNTPYTVQLLRYYAATRDFVGQVVEVAAADAARMGKPSPFRDAEAYQWADDISAIVPGFPNGNELVAGGDKLAANLLAKIIWNLSFSHTLDHYSYYCIPWDVNPWRLRQPPPESRDDIYDIDNAIARVDTWKFIQAQEVFFYTGSSTSMAKVDYRFKDAQLIQLNKEFVATLHKVNKIADAAKLIDLSAMGQSIDF